MYEFMPEFFVVKNYIKNYKKWHDIKRPYFDIETQDKKRKEEYDCYQDQYKEALAPLNVNIEDLYKHMEEEKYVDKMRQL